MAVDLAASAVMAAEGNQLYLLFLILILLSGSFIFRGVLL